jgi:flagellar hook protein FlgE
MSDLVSRYDGSSLTGALSREATALNNTAKATNDTAHNLAAEQTIAGRPRNTFHDIYHSYMGGEAAGYMENDVRYYIRGAGAPIDSQVKTHLSLLGEASFFPVQDTKGDTYFTRVGTFNYNASNQIENHFGMKLLYTPAVDGVIPATPSDLSSLGVLDCSDLRSDAQATSTIIFKCGINGNVGDSMTRAITVYDSSGTPRTLNYVFTRNADVAGRQSWNLTIQAPSDSTVDAPYFAGITILFNADGTPASFNGSATPPSLNITCPGATIEAAMDLGTVNKPDGVVQINGGQSRLHVQVNGHQSGVFKFLDTTEDGYIFANYDNNQRELIGRLVVGVFNNPDGLEMLDRGLYLPSTRSGTATSTYIGETPAGKVTVGALESSTIETIPQMAKMIERQHQFNNLTSTYGTVKSMLDKISNLRNA